MIKRDLKKQCSKKKIFSSICFSLTLYCSNAYEVIKPSELTPIITLIKETKNGKKEILDAFRDYFISDCPDDLDGLIEKIEDHGIKAYILDINNDGTNEYVFAYRQGSGQYLGLIIFSLENNKAKLLKDRLSYKVDWPFGEELFVKAQNKIYACGNPSVGDLNREIFLWENNKVTEVCNTFWINQQRKLFQKLYDKGAFSSAFSLLTSFEQKFRKKIAIKTDLLIRNDIALAAIKMKKYKTALEILEELKKEPAFNKTTKKFKNAVNFNFKLALEKLEHEKIHGTKGEYDYSWLLTSQDPILDERFDALINNTVPDINVKDIDRSVQVRLYMTSKVKVKNNRFVSFSGAWPHNATAQALFWCDTKEKISAVALNSCVDFDPGNMTANENILVTSKSLLFEEVPEDFLQELDVWVDRLLHDCVSSRTINKYIFYDRNGKATEFK